MADSLRKINLKKLNLTCWVSSGIIVTEVIHHSHKDCQEILKIMPGFDFVPAGRRMSCRRKTAVKAHGRERR